MSIYQDFYNTFINYWNENIDNFTKDYKGIANHKIIVVNDNKTINTPLLSNLLLQCFYTAFNGKVCDSDHWKYFNECLDRAYVKTKYFRDPMRFLNTFIEYWNENINSFIKRVGNKYDEKLITVVSNNGLKSIELTPISLQCFYTVFNGSVCDEDHWQYFQECLEYARRITGMQA